MPPIETRQRRNPERTRPTEWWHRFDPFRSLPIRASLVVGVVGVACALLAARAAGAALQREVYLQAGETFAVLAQQLADKVDRALWHRFHELQFVATLQQVRSPETTAADRRRALTTLASEYPDYAWVAFANPAGMVTAASPGLAENTDVKERSWFLLARNEPNVGPLSPTDALGPEIGDTEFETARPLVMDLSTPVVAIDGRFQGILGARVKWSLAHELQGTVLTPGLARRKVGASIYTRTGSVLLDTDTLGINAPLDVPTISGDTPRLRGFYWESTPAGLFLTGYARHVGHFEWRGQGWISVIRQSAGEVLAPVVRFESTIALYGIGLAVLAALITWPIAGRLTRRINAVAAASHRIRQGDVLTVIPAFRGEDESARMADVVADLVEDFREENEKLRKEVRRLESR